MKNLNLIVLLTMLCPMIHAQTVVNGNFTNFGTGWGCNPETNPVSIYGGSGSNRVAEVDASAGLCQTIPGFTVGAVYQIVFDCSRRTSCGPALQTMTLTVSGGALAPQTISRTGAFNFTQEVITFTANSTSHTITFKGTSAGTCGLIVDNIVLSLVTPLPIELYSFEAKAETSNSVLVEWRTASESNNDFFTVERSINGKNWQAICKVDGAGNSTSPLDYKTIDASPLNGISYYRLKQTDFDGNFTYSEIRSIDLGSISDVEINVSPNPTANFVIISGSDYELSQIKVFNRIGQDLTREVSINFESSEKVTIDLSPLTSGIYFIQTQTQSSKVEKF